VFHDALKGYACCDKRVTDFDDFLKIPGCTLGRHIPVENVASGAKPVSAKTSAQPVTVIDGKEVYGAVTAAAVAPTPTATPKPSTPPVVPAIKEEELFDSPDAIILDGIVCKRKSCGQMYSGALSREAQCVFHSGSPIFHEGSKGWSCCSRKVLEFDEFLKIPGCKTGKHRFTDPEVVVQQTVECRRDWYQTPTTVIVSIFAKKVDKVASKVEFFQDKININATFLDGKKYIETIPLALPIDPNTSKFTILSTKIELTIKKANGLSWPTLEPALGAVKSFTTFGVRNGSGQDAPLSLIKG
ncbi:hypothetical protein HK100_002474, partial [Physocladia obscura]